MSTPPRVRIAPSPTGDPHVGTAYVGLFNRAFADANGGTFILRIDDTDRTRYQADAEDAIFRALRWLGIQWDEGPDVGGPHAPYRQSERTAIYRDAIDKLLADGKAYRCFCTPERMAQLREEQRAAKSDHQGYDRRCRDIAADESASRAASGESHIVRLKVPLSGETSFNDQLRGVITLENANVDDQVLLKSDGFPTYHLANVVDDIAMGITHVVRAEEWITSAPKHVLLYEAFGEPLPLFFHVPLLRNADQSKISKRKNPVSLEWYRSEGYLPEALRNFLALLGWAPPDGEEVFDYAKFKEHFRLDDISTGAPVFDLVKLQWLNGVHLRGLSGADLHQRLSDEGFLPEGASPTQIADVLAVIGERLHLLGDFAEQSAFFFGDVTPTAAGLVPKKKEAADGARLLEALIEQLSAVGEWDEGTLEATVESTREAVGFNKPQIFMPLRMAVTGSTNSPPLPEVLRLLGRDRVLARLRAARDLLG
ncbi:MAG: glutamate--tRNA ligase [Planctomycetota bacterium]